MSNSPASTSRVLGLQVYITMPHSGVVLFKNYICLFVCDGDCMHVEVQRTAPGSRSSPYTMWALGSQLRLSGLAAKCFCLPRHPASPRLGSFYYKEIWGHNFQYS